MPHGISGINDVAGSLVAGISLLAIAGSFSSDLDQIDRCATVLT